MNKTCRAIISLSLAIVITISVGVLFPANINADSTTTEVDGLKYEWPSEGNKYPISTSTGSSTSSAATYGSFCLSGDITRTADQNGYKSFLVGSGNVELKYLYTDELISSNDSGDVNWHITDDNSKEVDTISLGSKVESGAIIIQTSLDGINWINDEIMTDVFETTRIQTGSIYSTNEIQLVNGTYYRFIVAYRERRLAGTSGWWVFRTSSYDYLECAEVYEFYLESEESHDYQNAHSTTQALGSAVNAGKSDGFNSADPIASARDPHYGWDLGHFFVSGYSDKIVEDGTYVFLKNVGDKVALNFLLEQNINALNGNENLVINRDMNGRDSYFQTDKNINFERGALIIRHIDASGVAQRPLIYTNFLEANTSPNAETKVYLFEEGDYEVALDYEICDEDGWDTYSNYRIYFKFKIRNGNCMVFPFDSVTYSELENLSLTHNGFMLDLAGSRYLHINVTRYVLNANKTGLDQRWSRPAADRTAYDEEGIYVITVTNDYAADSSYSKIICVGNNTVLNRYFRRNVVPNPGSLTNYGG